MSITSAEELAQRALDYNLLSQYQLQNVWGELGGSKNVSLDAFRKLLLSRDLLTYFQIEHLLAEDRDSFFYGAYKILYLVGTGTFARVYRATDPETGKQIAVKVLRKRFADIKEEAERFNREGQMGMQLKHPNIVPIYNVGIERNVPYIVIEFVEGRNLREFMKVRRILDPLDATRLIHDVCNGLDYASKQGIYHRDMKMSNVLVSSRGQAKLVDFGLAGTDKQLSDEMLAKNPNPRAIDYAGLERATGVHKNDPRSDIFFVGGMYYQMVSGKSAMSSTKDRAQRLSRGRYADIPPISQANPNLPADVAAAIHRAVQFDPERRYQTAGEMAADLKQILDRAEVKEPAAKPAVAAKAVAQAEAADDASQREGLDSFGNPRKLMIVEADVRMQDVFRQKFKQNGYRVLVSGDPQRACKLFDDDPHAFDIGVFSTGEIGEPAITGFNEFGKNPKTQNIPAVLLLGERQAAWRTKAEGLAPHREVATMPITVRQLREIILRVIKGGKVAAAK